MEPHKESSVKYDDRRKELTHTTKEVKETEFGILNLESKGIYKEEGIRKILANLESKKKVIEKNIEILRKLQEPTPKLTPEFEKLKDQLSTLQKIDHDEKVTKEDRKKELEDLKQNEEALKEVKEDIRKIRETIGSRLKI